MSCEIFLDLEPATEESINGRIPRNIGCDGCKSGSGRYFVKEDEFKLPGEGVDIRSWPSSEQDQPCLHASTRHGETSGICRSGNVKS